MKKKNKQFLFWLIFLLAFFLPSGIEAFVPDFLTQSVNFLTKHYGLAMGTYYFSVLVLFAGGFLLLLSTSLLQWILDITPEILTVSHGASGQIIGAAWNFSSGIVNMLLILAFLFIAIATILGVEKYQLQKLLPKLVIVALLINFTLLFVGMGIDVANILFNSVTNHFSGDNILYEAISPMFAMVHQVVLTFLGLLVGFSLTALSPFGPQVVMIANILGFSALLPVMVGNLINGLVLLSLSSLFGIFFVIFLARIFIIQLLAVISPFAFLCLIFPDTKKYWDMWLSHLIQWLLTGVVFIFFIYIGIALMPIITLTMTQITQADANILITAFVKPFIPPLILAVYFLSIIALTKRLMPELARISISAAKQAWAPAKGIGLAAAKGSLQHRVPSRGSMPKGHSLKSVFGGFGGTSLSGHLDSFTNFRKRTQEQRQGEQIDHGLNAIGSSPQAINDAFKGSSDDFKQMIAVLKAIKEGLIHKTNDIQNMTPSKYGELYKLAESMGKGGDFAEAMPAHHAVSQKISPEKMWTDELKSKETKENFGKSIPRLMESKSPEIRDVTENMIKITMTSGDIGSLTGMLEGTNSKGINKIRQIAKEVEENGELDSSIKQHLERRPGSIVSSIFREPFS